MLQLGVLRDLCKALVFYCSLGCVKCVVVVVKVVTRGTHAACVSLSFEDLSKR